MTKIFHILRRAMDGARRRPWMYALSCMTLTAAFLSFGATLTAAANLNHLLAKWIGSAEITVYLAPTARAADYDRLAGAIARLEQVEKVVPVLPEEARNRFADELGEFGDMARSLSASAFPGSLDIHLQPAVSRDPGARKALAGRLAKLELIQEVDLYDAWYERLSALTFLGRLAAWGLGLLALVVAVLVVTGVVRHGVAARAKEIEVLRLVGATGTYVRLPFLVEGALQASLAMGLALGALHLVNDYIQNVAAAVFPLIGAGGFIRLGSQSLWMLAIGAAMAGIIGARMSLRGLEEV